MNYPRIALFISFMSCIHATENPAERPDPVADGGGERAAGQVASPVVENRIAIARPNLRVDRFFKEEGIPQSVRTQVDLDPESAEFFDLANERFQFSPDELDLMKTHGFAVRPGSYGGSFGMIYYDIWANDLPVLVTSDSILHALHSSYDEILMDLEEGYFRPTIRRVLRTTRTHMETRATGSEALEQRAELQAADLYLTVALSLLNGKQAPSLLNQGTEVTRILKLVHSGQFGRVELHGESRVVDFSQFKPRGHYTKRAPLKNYFRAMMWMGRADTGLVLSTTTQLKTAATLTLLMRDAGVLESLNKISDVMDFMVGGSDNLTPFRLATLLEEMKLDSLDALVSEAALSALSQRISQDGEGIQNAQSQFLESNPHDSRQARPPPLFQVFGQREVIDGRVMQEVVYDRIVFENQKQRRTMPSSLDVMAGLGNNEALALLEDELRAWNYSGNMAAVRTYVEDKPDEFWEANLYNLWLDALRALHQPLTGTHAPQAMQTKAWQRKQLNTQLASWSQLRHDTILYTKQTVGMSIGCVYPKGAVEPYPEFYDKLGHFARRAVELFQGVDESVRILPSLIRYFKGMDEVMSRLKSLAEKQLAAKPYSAEDEEWMDGLIRRELKSAGYAPTPVYNGWYVDLYYDRDKAINWEPTIADVYTDPNGSPTALEVGVGNLHTLFAVIDNDGDQTIHIGPTLSFYQFSQPATNRLTDKEWAAMLAQGQAPPRPEWTRIYESAYSLEAESRVNDMRIETLEETYARMREEQERFEKTLALHQKEEERARQERLGWTDNVRWKNDEVIVIGSVAREEVNRGVAAIAPDLQRCYERHARFAEPGWRKWVVHVDIRKDGRLGKAWAGSNVHVDIRKDGRLGKAWAGSKSFDNPSLESCLLARFKDLRVEKADSEGKARLTLQFQLGSDPQP